ncbi:eRF1 domain 2 [Leptospira broomii serovar Hurstbridge str. 5399]|uniref:ERF1 domain 2 n=1 Tax=Leptospira broomii serovar Hurstbridge str. 5399 TaxID=1049789 RepID=T0F882_9LEPT|nr:hypothetical protein [Leptospira broomii]EQA43717.1 eRF1 domain 2 [Leptospira broomii serovar Hurstbridge str. 5399]
MQHSILWIDSEQAKGFVFTKDSFEMNTDLDRIKPKHHDNHLDRIDQIHNEEIKHFFHEVSQKLGTASDLLIAGPGMAKNHFKSYLETHMPELAKKVVGVVTMDHPTAPEIIKSAKEYYHDHHLKI